MESTERIPITSFYFRMARTLVAKCTSKGIVTTCWKLFKLLKLLKLLEEKSHSNVLFSTLLHPQDLASRLGRCLLAAVCTVVLTGLGKTKVYSTSNSLRTK